MSKLEEIKPDKALRGILPDQLVTVVNVKWHGDHVLELTYKDGQGRVDQQLLFRDSESTTEVVHQGRPWSFDGDGAQFRLVSEAHRIRLAHLFDPVLAVHTSLVEPLPHQISAVYEEMLPRQPLRFLLADDPGAGKTIMAGLLIKELIARGDLHRCLIVCPGSLVEQWQDELSRRFQLHFEILTNDNLAASRTGNWFSENNLVIARLDKLSRDEEVQRKLEAPDCGWDLVVCDEAHKMSASFFNGEARFTKRYRLGQLLGRLTRHFLLMSATPHNGKDEDFQLFMALLDPDRFEGRFRDGVHKVDVSDLMRRMVKEKLLKFDGKPLFPERIAHTVPYELSEAESQLYKGVTSYVRTEFNRAEALANEKRVAVGFALTILQRRLASSPEAIYRSLRRRRDRLDSLFGKLSRQAIVDFFPSWNGQDLEDLEDSPEREVEETEQALLDQATAACTLEELNAEIGTLTHLEGLAAEILRHGGDTKWRELTGLLKEIFTPAAVVGELDNGAPPCSAGQVTGLVGSPRQKLVIFSEYRDTVNYLEMRIGALLGKREAVAVIHGQIGREQRLKAQEAFCEDVAVRVLISTDAAAEGINLQRAHLMVNYDLPWNPNRLEQRFGRIHRIGQSEVCYLWNLIAKDTREGDVYRTLLDKLELARRALGGQVFNVLGKLHFQGRALRELLVEAIRHGESPDVRARLQRTVADAVDQTHLLDFLDDRALARNAMDASRVARVREDMDRADARRLQPHFVEAFFLEAFRQLGGRIAQPQPRLYKIDLVPVLLRGRNRQKGRKELVSRSYECVGFEKDLTHIDSQASGAFLCPGHPLLDATLDVILERHRDLLQRGTVLVDEQDQGVLPRVLFYLELAVQDAIVDQTGRRRIVSKRLLYVETNAEGQAQQLHCAPYLDYRPLCEQEPNMDEVLALAEFAWISQQLESKALGYAIAQVVPEHLESVRSQRQNWSQKARLAVRDRLVKEIDYWDNQAEDLKAQEQAGKVNARLNSQEAGHRAEDLRNRLHTRMEHLDQESKLSALPPVALGGVVVVPIGLLYRMGVLRTSAFSPGHREAAAKSIEAVMQVERSLGFEPVHREQERLGYDIESRDKKTGKLRFIKVTGQVSGEEGFPVTRNEILTSLNKPDDYILAIVEFHETNGHQVHYLRQPFHREPEFGVSSVNYSVADLLRRALPPS